MRLIVGGEEIPVDKEGYLKNLGDWNEHVATLIAANDGIELSDAHWEVLRALQNFYQLYGYTPSMRPLIKFIAQELGAEKGKSIYLLQLFPGSPAKLASKIAGLPRPNNCL